MVPEVAGRMGEGYTLVICEKPDAARRVADALSGGKSTSTQVEGTAVYSFASRGEEFVVCSAQGHVYEVSDPSGERAVYPVFDVEWYSSDLVNERSHGAENRIAAVKRLAAGAAKFVNACDFDVEGETIGFNLLKYACGGKEDVALRAKFSTLTETDLKKAFDELTPGTGQGLARAGRARHVIDFVWGVNLSRALSQAALRAGRGYRTISVGRVQGPTLGFLAQREREIRGFVPVPYWKVSGVFVKDGKKVSAGYSNRRIATKALADRIREECLGKEAVVKSVRGGSVLIPPPVPFNIGDLQREAYRMFRFPPRKTLQVAEKLYLSALISYPRTGSQKLPSSIGYATIIEGLGKIGGYSASAAEILRAVPKPAQGTKTDPAHPAIHPTGMRPRRRLDAAESSVFDLVARRFLAAFGEPARRDVTDATLAVGEREFRASGAATVFEGWMKHYGRYALRREAELEAMAEGDRLGTVDVSVEEKFEQRPARYNQSTLLERMEKEGIGTKATRADIIATLIGRGYVSSESMEVSDLGFSVVDSMAKYAPQILSVQLTRDVEEKLGSLEKEAGAEAPLLREMVRSIAGQLERLGANEEGVTTEIGSALTRTAPKPLVLGSCPVCKKGELRVIRSRATKKRFVGCSNYQSGCVASGPLPQKGDIKATAKRCNACSWPIVYVVGLGRPWRLCINPKCPAKRKP